MRADYLNFKSANCKNCYKCLRECPVKAITVIDDRAKINSDLCILCGHCSNVCRYNAKEVVRSADAVRALIKGKKPVCASVAPAFAASFTPDFAAFSAALKKLGFARVEETARGAALVTENYRELLREGKYKNLIASACPAIVRLIQIYYPDALPYLAPVLSPMAAHAKILREEHSKDEAIVFIGPCIAKKREADECGMIDEALTFEELKEMFFDAGITFDESPSKVPLPPDFSLLTQKAKYYPINRGIIKSFSSFPDGYEYISVDGVRRAEEVLSNINSLSGMFIEMHACEFSCINGPCALKKESGGFIKATETIRGYARSGIASVKGAEERTGDLRPKITAKYPRISDVRVIPPEYEIKKILEATGKFTPEDELNCGACGYNTCRDKAIAVYNNMAQLSMCVPYMRERAEGLSYDIIQNSPNGILAVDDKFCITEINEKAVQLLGMPSRAAVRGEELGRFYNPTDFYLAMYENEQLSNKKLQIEKTGAWVEMTIRRVSGQNLLFCIMKDITQDEDYRRKLSDIKAGTIATADEVIKKQMRVVQEIASLLGETAAETKIALVRLRDTIGKDEVPDERKN